MEWDKVNPGTYKSGLCWKNLKVQLLLHRGQAVLQRRGGGWCSAREAGGGGAGHGGAAGGVAVVHAGRNGAGGHAGHHGYTGIAAVLKRTQKQLGKEWHCSSVENYNIVNKIIE